jgi:hypothetical protein
MSATKAEQIVDLVVTTLSAVDGTGAYDTDLRGRVFAADQVTPIQMRTSPTVVVGFDAIDAGTGLRERNLAVAIDVFADADYAAARGVSVKSLLLRIRTDIEAALYAVRYTAPLLSHQEFQGASLLRAEDGTTQNGITMRFQFVYTEERAA